MPKFYTREELLNRAEKANIVVAKDGKIADSSVANVRAIYENAMDEGITLTEALERRDPSTAEDSLDAYERMLALNGIITKADTTKGIYATNMSRFYSSSTVAKYLVPEFIRRNIVIAENQYDPTRLIVATTTPVNSVSAGGLVINTETTEARLNRVSEGGELPKMKLAMTGTPIKLKKYGAQIEATYEVIAATGADLFGTIIRGAMGNTMMDRAADAMAAAMTGATTVNLVSDLGGTSGVMSHAAHVAMLMKFATMPADRVVGNAAGLTKFLQIQFPNGDPIQLLTQYANAESGLQVEVAPGLFRKIILVLVENSALDNKLVYMSSQYALNQYTNPNLERQESDRIIERQLDIATVSISRGYEKLLPGATKVLVLNS